MFSVLCCKGVNFKGVKRLGLEDDNRLNFSAVKLQLGYSW